MSTLKVNTIADPDNGNTAITIDSSGNATFAQNLSITGSLSGDGSALTGISAPLSFRNHVINGAFQVWQRGTTITHAYAWSGDRWQNRTGSTVTWARSTTVPDGFMYSNECNAASSIATMLELPATGSRGPYTSGKSFTVSVWSTVQPTLYVAFSDSYGPGNPQVWGNADTATMTSTGETSNGFTRYSLTITAATTIAGTNTGVFVRFAWPSAHKFTGVQLEEGTSATTFEHRPYGEELAKCQRYYYSTYEEGTDPGTATYDGCYEYITTVTHGYQNQYIQWSTMRTNPGIAVYSPYSGASGVCSADASDRTMNTVRISKNGAMFYVNNSSIGSGANLRIHYTLDAEL